MNENKLLKINKYFRITLLILFLLGFVYNYYKEDWYSVAITLISPIVIYVPHIFKYFKLELNEHYKLLYYLIVFLGLLIGETVGIYIMTYWYDKLVHGLTGLLLSILGTIILTKRSEKKNMAHKLWKILLFGIFCGANKYCLGIN